MLAVSPPLILCLARTDPPPGWLHEFFCSAVQFKPHFVTHFCMISESFLGKVLERKMDWLDPESVKRVLNLPLRDVHIRRRNSWYCSIVDGAWSCSGMKQRFSLLFMVEDYDIACLSLGFIEKTKRNGEQKFSIVTILHECKRLVCFSRIENCHKTRQRSVFQATQRR